MQKVYAGQERFTLHPLDCADFRQTPFDLGWEGQGQSPLKYTICEVCVSLGNK
jgi:hypothetical protein